MPRFLVAGHRLGGRGIVRRSDPNVEHAVDRGEVAELFSIRADAGGGFASGSPNSTCRGISGTPLICRLGSMSRAEKLNQADCHYQVLCRIMVVNPLSIGSGSRRGR